MLMILVVLILVVLIQFACLWAANSETEALHAKIDQLKTQLWQRDNIPPEVLFRDVLDDLVAQKVSHWIERHKRSSQGG